MPSRVQRLWPFLAGALLTYPLPYLVVRSSVPDCYRIAFTGPRLTDDLGLGLPLAISLVKPGNFIHPRRCRSVCRVI